MKRSISALLSVFALSLSAFAASPDVTVTLSHFTYDFSGAGHVVRISPLTGGVAARALTDSDGIATFTSVTPARYSLSLDGVGVPTLEIKVPSSSDTLSAFDLLTSPWTPEPAAGVVSAYDGTFTHSLTLNGDTITEWPTVGTSTVGTVINTATVSAGDIASYADSAKTNLAKATSSNLQAALGSVYQSTNATLTALAATSTTGTGTIPLTSVTDVLATKANSALTGTPTINGASIETQLTNKVAKAGDVMTGALTTPILNASEALMGALAVSRGTLAMTGTNVLIDFAQTNRIVSCTLTGTVVNIIATNASAGKKYAVRFRMPSSNVTPTFQFVPAGSITNWLGGAPSTMTANTVGDMLLESQDATTNSVIAAYIQTQ